MHIREVILDGFKSYGTRTVIGDFDPHFNAITGLNGSGKSNILDGIVFVLGLTALNQVRAQNLSDLIHKGGNVRRASASIVLDNTNKRKSPIGFEKYDELIVSRTIEEGSHCKYSLNSSNTTKKVVQDLFESVQLNINNPNFMIMQGKITKVVNMKPKETLGMIEESIGALTYQSKRDKAVRELDAKGKQIQEINEMLTNVIEPAIRKQQTAHHIFEQFKIVDRERVQHRQDYAIAAFGHYTKQSQEKKDQIKRYTDSDSSDQDIVQTCSTRIEELKHQREQINDEIKLLVTDKLSKIEKDLKEGQKKFAITEGAHDDALQTVKECEDKVKRARKELEKEQKQNENYEKQKGALLTEFTSIKADIETAEKNLTVAKEKESEVQAGKVLGDDGQTFDLREKIVSLDEKIQAIKPNHDYETMMLKSEVKSLADKQNQLRKTPSDKQIEQNYQQAKQAHERLIGQMSSKGISPEEYANIDQQLNQVGNTIRKCDSSYRDMQMRFPRLEFTYTDPHPNFNRNSVHGCVYEMFEVEDTERYKSALEVGSSGSFDIVIVDTPDVCKAIINHGNVSRRRSYMPLTSIKARNPVTQGELDRELGPGRAVPAVSVVKCEQKYQKVINHYMGGLVLCDTMSTAKIVAFKMKHRAVTLDGDLCDPDGAMQGGTRKNCGEYLLVCQKLRKLSIERKRLVEQYQILMDKNALFKSNAELLKSFDKACSDLENATEERRCTAYASLIAEIKQLEESIAAKNENLKKSGEELTILTKERDNLSKKLESYDQEKIKSLKAAKMEVAKWTKALDEAKRKYNLKEASFNSVEMDVKAKDAMLANYQQDILNAERELDEAKADEIRKKTAFEEARVVFHDRKKAQEEASTERSQKEDEMKKIEIEMGKCQKQLNNIELEKMKRDNNRKNLESQLAEIAATINQLVENHPELDLLKNYDTLEKPKHSVKKCKEMMDATEKKYEELRQKVDPRAAQQLDDSKEKQRAGKEKLTLLYANQKKLREAIEQLDKQKAEMVRSAYRSVNDEFGKMMSTLLPESTAKLVPVSNREDHLDDGVNIHVKLGGVWKESLTELSGGQRSLVALALVLSLCMYQPAPFYVLDEIDAALDLSHTQNIGVLIKERFKDTQFICVSLKDGMFSNANVLFQTQFTDGKSTVTRNAKNRENNAGVDPSKYAHLGKKRDKGERGRRL